MALLGALISWLHRANRQFDLRGREPYNDKAWQRPSLATTKPCNDQAVQRPSLATTKPCNDRSVQRQMPCNDKRQSSFRSEIERFQARSSGAFRLGSRPSQSGLDRRSAGARPSRRGLDRHSTC